MTDVLVVGAGPTGLVLALMLARRGIGVRIIDRLAGPQKSSRALGVHARTLEFYRMMGFADEIVAAGTVAEGVNVRAGSRVVSTLPLGTIGKGQSYFPFVLFLSQDVHEDLLREQLSRAGVTIEWGTELVGIDRLDGKVRARLRTREGETDFETRYLCGADGAHSAVRHLLGIGFPGHTDSKLFFVADAEIEGGVDVPALELCVNRSGMGAVMPSRDAGALRYLGLVPPELEGGRDLTLEQVAGPVLKQTGHRIRRVNWFSTYRVHHRVAERFRAGPVFLLGDAGHVHSPAGAQGMNTGIGDAVNLGWKLADVIGGRARPELLDSYEPERIAFARELVRGTDHAFTLMAGQGWTGRFMREVVVPHVAARVMRRKFVQRLMFRTVSQTRIAYRDSPLSSGRAGRIAAGDRMPFVSEPDNHAPLRGDWQVQVYGDVPGAAPEGIGTERFALNTEARAKGILDGTAYLLRPDGHIAAMARGANAMGDVAQYLRTLR